MKRVLLPVLCVALLSSAVVATAQTYTWTGIGNGWKGQVPPPNDGTANLQFGDNVSTFIPIPSLTFSINSAAFISDNRFLFVPQSVSSTLNIGAGGMTASNMFGGSTNIDFASGITVNLAASQTWDFGSGGGSAIIHGALTGGNLTLTGSSNYDSFGLTMASLTAGLNSSYTGTITLGNSTVPNLVPFLAVWASGNLGTGNITFVNGGQLITHNTTSLPNNLPNNLLLNTGPLPAGNNNNVFTPVNFKAWDAPMTLSGNALLYNNTTINAQISNPNIPSLAPGNTGSWPLAGPRKRNPIIFTGTIGEFPMGTSLNITGPGIVILAGSNSTGYTGGTYVGFQPGTGFSQQGNLIFANQGAIPTPTLPIVYALQSGQLNFAGSSGYIGIADTAVSTAGAFSNFLTKFNPNSSGAVGIDSLDGVNAPSSIPHTFSDNINLTSFTTSGNMGIRFGTATSLIFTGSITPQLPNVYHFGNGGGRLFMNTGLADQITPTSVTRSLRAESQGAFPLHLFLQGTNTYTGGTVSNYGIVVFDGANAIPASGSLEAFGASTNVGSSYIGYTDSTGFSSSAFLAKFNQATTWGIIGFDTHFDPATGTPNSTVNIANLDLTGFNDGVFIGTNSSAILSGTIKPTSVTNADHGANTLRFTATSGGTLTVSSILADNPSVLGVTLGSPAGIPAFSDGTIILSSANTYTGGTAVNNYGNLSLVAGHSTAFGASTGSITLRPHGGVLALSAGTAGVNLANPIVFGQATPMTGYTPTLNLTGSNDFTLSGNISGPNRAAIYTQNDVGQGLIALNNLPPVVNATISGNNSGFYGTFLVANGTLTFASDNAPGHAQIEMLGGSGTVAFTSANPVVYGLTNGGAGGGTVSLGAGTNLTVDTTDSSDGTITGQGNGDYDFDFGGSFVGDNTTKLTVTSTINPSVGSDFFYVYGSSPSFSGSVDITGQAALALGQSNSVGSGTITINAVDGGLALNTGVTLTNPLVFNQGGLAGIGTFQPVSVSGTGQTAGKLTFGANQMVFPGIPGDEAMPGKLTLAMNTAFATGGNFMLVVENPANTADGFGSLNITGSLDLVSISAAGFVFNLESISPNGETGFSPAIVWGNSYSLLVVSTTGGITGFDQTKFAVDVTKFQDGLIPAAYFSVTADANNLYLNFTAIPEPSTWALLVTGAGFLGLAAWRRRRA
ncbi:MAG: PEP-CTERM sorting domain-containing protein [Opitutae bacterium]|nr:PEP-CTERM sorting domain-containing protein [Opitutae bacterium]